MFMTHDQDYVPWFSTIDEYYWRAASLTLVQPFFLVELDEGTDEDGQSVSKTKLPPTPETLASLMRDAGKTLLGMRTIMISPAWFTGSTAAWESNELIALWRAKSADQIVPNAWRYDFADGLTIYDDQSCRQIEPDDLIWFQVV